MTWPTIATRFLSTMPDAIIAFVASATILIHFPEIPFVCDRKQPGVAG